MPGKIAGHKNRKKKLIEAIIERVGDNDAAQIDALRRFFTGAMFKPVSFFKQIEVIAREVQEHAPVLTDGVYVVALAGGPGAMVLVTPALATRKISEGSHRLATREEVKAWTAPVAISVGDS